MERWRGTSRAGLSGSFSSGMLFTAKELRDNWERARARRPLQKIEPLE